MIKKLLLSLVFGILVVTTIGCEDTVYPVYEKRPTKMFDRGEIVNFKLGGGGLILEAFFNQKRDCWEYQIEYINTSNTYSTAWFAEFELVPKKVTAEKTE